VGRKRWATKTFFTKKVSDTLLKVNTREVNRARVNVKVKRIVTKKGTKGSKGEYYGLRT